MVITCDKNYAGKKYKNTWKKKEMQSFLIHRN